ncbi:hypothetical protein BDZ97DRAFT_1938242 [Flammula alnicola]|nr:hypothetical protein BDZ97DRAFT_1938242 [Flammula alnicola]
MDWGAERHRGGGVIIAVGYIPPSLLAAAQARGGGKLRVQDVGGKWVTPGLVDLHSHIGVYSSPALSGASDGNSRKSPILPWLRSIDGLNTHDASYELAIAGGVTTAQVLPGSANNMGGQAFVIKLRPTAERSATSKVIEPPLTLTHSPNGTDYIRWRHMKLYGQTRMDGQWNFRHAYDEARTIRDAQDAFCAKVEAGEWDALEGSAEFPEDLQWESLVDVLRGRVKAVDLDGIVRLSNEFKETYLVPDCLRRHGCGGAPSIALFASNFRWKKREAYRGSEFAPRILAEHGIPVVMKSDHPAHYYGLNPALALASVTSVPARAAGLGHRVGTIAEDIVIWDSHPLTLGATPTQVYVDGIAQLSHPYPLEKPAAFQELPETPNWDKEKNDTVRWEGLPPLTGHKVVGRGGRVRVVGVKSLIGFNEMDDEHALETVFDDAGAGNDSVFPEGRVVLVEDGKIVCIQRPADSCASAPSDVEEEERFKLICMIRLEPSTNDGPVFDPLIGGDLPPLLSKGKEGGLIRAVDGLTFEGRGTLLAYRSGVTTAITAPSGYGFSKGSLRRSALAHHMPRKGHSAARDGFACDVELFAASKRQHPGCGPEALLFGGKENIDRSEAGAWGKVRECGKTLKLTFSGGTEAHLLAKEIATAGVSVILTSSRPYPALPGPPLSEMSAVTTLLDAGVNVAIGVVDESSARNTRFEIAWAALESNGTISKSQALALASTNLHKALGLVRPLFSIPDLVMYRGGGLLDFESKVVGVMSAERPLLNCFEQ